VLTVAVALVAYVGSGRIIAPAERRRRTRRRADLPGALELMASCLRAGLPVRGAAAAVAAAHSGPLADDIGVVLAQIAIGDSESRAWLRLAHDEAWGLVARDLARSVESGTTLVELLQAHADRGRRERHAAVVAAARTVGVRSVLPLMTCYLPAFMLVGIVPIIAGAVPTLLS
jgi:pilus assembly protein TadC